MTSPPPPPPPPPPQDPPPPDPLLPHHREHLHTSALSDTTIAVSGICSVTDANEAGRLLGWRGPYPQIPAIVFPVHDAAGQAVSLFLRPDHPRSEGGKYEPRPGERMRLYFTPPPLVATSAWTDTSIPLEFTEGGKKALACAQQGLACISALGVSCFHDTAHREATGEWRLHPDLASVPLQGRTVFVAFDGGDTTHNVNVIVAEARLARMLLDAGARVRLVRIPFKAGGPKVGVDDYLVTQADPKASLEKLMADAIDAEPLARATALRAVADPLARINARLGLLKDLSFLASLELVDGFVVSRVREGLQVSTADLDEARDQLHRRQAAAEQEAGPRKDDIASEPQDTGALLGDVVAAYARHLALPEGGEIALGLWTLHGWTVGAFRYSPRLAVTSPSKRCGKTLVLEIQRELCPRPILAANISTAALYRAIASWQPTILIDEADSFLGEHDELRGVLNAGYEANGVVVRCVGDDHEPTEFKCFGAVAIATIGELPPTLADRAVTIPMSRKSRAAKLRRLDRAAREALAALRPRLARWARDSMAVLRVATPEAPEALNDRQRDICEPLFAIADLARGDWPGRARTVLVSLSEAAGADAADLPERLLAALRKIFYPPGILPIERLSFSEIVEALLADTVAGWDEANRGKPVTSAWVSRVLGRYRVSSRQWREPGKPGRPRGYYSIDLVDVFARYLPPDPPPPDPPGGNRRDGVTDPQPQGFGDDPDGMTGSVTGATDGVTPPSVTPDTSAVTSPVTPSHAHDSHTATGPVTPSREETTGVGGEGEDSLDHAKLEGEVDFPFGAHAPTPSSETPPPPTRPEKSS